MSGASMWLDARAGAGSSRSPTAAVSVRAGDSVVICDFMCVTSCAGWCDESPLEYPKLRRKQHEAQGARSAGVAGRIGGSAVGGGDHGGVQIQPGILRALGQCARHERRRVRWPSGRRQRPCERVDGEDVLTAVELAPGEFDGGVAVLPACREIQREGTGIAGGSIVAESLLDDC